MTKPNRIVAASRKSDPCKNLIMELKLIIAGAITVLVALTAGYFVGYDRGYQKAVKSNIGNFEECAAAGFPVLETFPERCAVPGGGTFTKNVN